MKNITVNNFRRINDANIFTYGFFYYYSLARF